MRLLFTALACLISVSVFGQQTYIPDDNFEQRLIQQGYDDVLDDFVLTANINTITWGQFGDNGGFDSNIADLTGIQDFSALTSLQINGNLITNLDLTNNNNLIILFAGDNPFLTTVDLRNGHNLNLSPDCVLQNIPLLSCIYTDLPAHCDTVITFIDPQHYFSIDCLPSTIQEHQRTAKELLKITDLLGRETKQTNKILVYIYDDGSVEKKFIVE